MTTYDHLEPYLSSESLYFVFDEITPKLLNELKTQSKELEPKPTTLNTLFLHDNPKIAYQALMCYSHLFWQKCLKLEQSPTTETLNALLTSFGSIEKFHAEVYRQAAFDVRYLYLVKHGDKLQLVSDQDLAIIHTSMIILTINLWEHAYYLDYRHRKDDYLRDFLTKMINWSFVGTCLTGAGSLEIELP